MCAQIYLYATLCTGKVLTFVVLGEPESKRYASLYLAWTADTQETGVESLPPIDFLAAAVTVCVCKDGCGGEFNVSG